MRLLIVNADDFGLTESVSRGILRAHTEGIVTSTSLLVVGAAFDRTAQWLESVPDLGLGVHLALVGGDRPVLSTREIPSLVDRTGRLWGSWRSFLSRALVGQIDPSDVRRELGVQIEKALARGLSITHLDSHQHLHLWPAVRDVVVDLARSHGIPGVRIPRASGKRLSGYGVRWLASSLERVVSAAGLCFTGGFHGFDEAGGLTEAVLDEVLGRIAVDGASTVELCAHPGDRDEPGMKAHAWGYRWGDELAALTRPGLRARIEASGLTLGSYGTLGALRARSVP